MCLGHGKKVHVLGVCMCVTKHGYILSVYNRCACVPVCVRVRVRMCVCVSFNLKHIVNCECSGAAIRPVLMNQRSVWEPMGPSRGSAGGSLQRASSTCINLDEQQPRDSGLSVALPTEVSSGD